MKASVKRATAEAIHRKQFDETQKLLTAAITPVIEKQVSAIVAHVSRTGELPKPQPKTKLVDACFPILLQQSLRAAKAEMLKLHMLPSKR